MSVNKNNSFNYTLDGIKSALKNFDRSPVFGDYKNPNSLGAKMQRTKFIYENAEKLYYTSEDPREEAYKQITINSIRNELPGLSEEYLRNNLDEYVYQSTGQKIKSSTLMEVFGQKVISGFAGFAEGADAIINTINESFYRNNHTNAQYDVLRQQNDKKRKNAWYSKATNQRTDYYAEFDDTFIERAILGLGDTLPSLVASSAGMVGAYASQLVNITNAAKVYKVGKRISDVVNFTMEMGNMVKDLRKENATPEEILLASAVYGAFSTYVEHNLDKIPEEMIAKPAGKMLKKFKETGSGPIRGSVVKAFGGAFAETAIQRGVEWLSETSEEAVQQLGQDVVYNILSDYREFSGLAPLSDRKGAEEIWNDVWATFKSMGETQALLSVLGFAGGLGYKSALGDVHYISSANKNFIIDNNTEFTSANNIININRNAKKTANKSDSASVGKYEPVRGFWLSNGKFLAVEGDVAVAQELYSKDKNAGIAVENIGKPTENLEKISYDTAKKINKNLYDFVYSLGNNDLSVGVDNDGTIEISDAKYLNGFVSEIAKEYGDKITNISVTENGASIETTEGIINIGTDLSNVSYRYSDTEEAKQRDKINQQYEEMVDDAKKQMKADEKSYRKKTSGKIEADFARKLDMESSGIEDAKERALAKEENIKVYKGYQKQANKVLSDMGYKDGETKTRLNQALSHSATILSIRMAKATNQSVSDFSNKINIEFLSDEEYNKKTSRKADISVGSDGKYSIRLSRDMNATSLMHEMSHALLLTAGRENWKNIEGFESIYSEQLKADEENIETDKANGKSYWRTQEAFASDFEKYMTSGVVKDEALRSVFQNLKETIRQIYNYMVGSLSDEKKAMFDKLFGGEVVGASETQAIGTLDQDIGIIGAIKAYNNGNTEYLDSLKKAINMFNNGKTYKEIYDETGWFKLPYGSSSWRYYVNDKKYLREDAMSNIKKLFNGNRKFMLLSDIYNDEFFKIYGELRDVIINTTKKPQNDTLLAEMGGGYIKNDTSEDIFKYSVLNIFKDNIKNNLDYTNAELTANGFEPTDIYNATLSEIVHETQHFIQAIERTYGHVSSQDFYISQINELEARFQQYKLKNPDASFDYFFTHEVDANGNVRNGDAFVVSLAYGANNEFINIYDSNNLLKLPEYEDILKNYEQIDKDNRNRRKDWKRNSSVSVGNARLSSDVFGQLDTDFGLAEYRDRFSKETTKFEEEYNDVIREYSNTKQWLKAPNGKPTNLTERQWVQVRTPSFKAWFGDWENDPENASKIVDENGEPLALWHGSREGLFDTFIWNVGGFFFTDDLATAESYIKDRTDRRILKLYNVFLNARNVKVVDSNNHGYRNSVKDGEYAVQINYRGLTAFLEIFETKEELENHLNSKSETSGKTMKELYDEFGYRYGKIGQGADEINAVTNEYAFAMRDLKGYDSVIFKSIVENEIDKSYSSNDYVVFNSNQIKSATGNNGNFSNETGNIYEQDISFSDTIEALEEKLKSGEFPTSIDFIKYADTDQIKTENLIADMFEKDYKALDLVRYYTKQYVLNNEMKKSQLSATDYSKIYENWKERMDRDGDTVSYEGDGAYFIERALTYLGMRDTEIQRKMWLDTFDGARAHERVRSTVEALVKQGVVSSDTTRFPYLSTIANRLEKSGKRAYLESGLYEGAINEIKKNSEEIYNAVLRAENNTAQADFNEMGLKKETEYVDKNSLSTYIHSSKVPMEVRKALVENTYGGEKGTAISELINRYEAVLENSELQELSLDETQEYIADLESELKEASSSNKEYKNEVRNLERQLEKAQEVRDALLSLESMRKLNAEKQKDIESIKKYANKNTSDVYVNQHLKGLFNALIGEDENGKATGKGFSVDHWLRGDNLTKSETNPTGFGALDSLRAYLLDNGFINKEGVLLKDLTNLDAVSTLELELLRDAFTKQVEEIKENTQSNDSRRQKFIDKAVNKFTEHLRSQKNADELLKSMDRVNSGSEADKKKNSRWFKSIVNNPILNSFIAPVQILRKMGLEDIVIGTADGENYGLYQYNNNRLDWIGKRMKGFNEFAVDTFGKKIEDVLYDMKKDFGKIDATGIEFADGNFTEEQAQMVVSMIKADLLSDGVDTNFTMENLLTIWIYSQQTQGLQKLISKEGNGLSIEQVAYVRQLFETEEMAQYKALGQYMINEMGSRFPQLADVLKRTSNQILKHVESYYPLIGANHDLDSEVSMQERVERAYLPDRFIKSREGSQYPLSLDGVRNFQSNIEMQENYIAGAEMFQNFNKLFGKEGKLSTYITNVYGSHASKTVRDYIQLNQGVHTFRTELDNAINKLRSNYTISKLAFNLSSVFQQPASLFLGLERYSATKLAGSLARCMKTDMHSYITEELGSVQMAQRANLDVSFAREMKSTILGDTKLGQKIDFDKAYKKFIDAGLWGMETTDRIIAEALWITAYEDNIGKGMSHEQALMDADMWVMNIQSNTNPMYNALAYSSDNPLLKMTMMFTNQLNKQFNMITAAIQNGSIKQIGKTLASLALSAAFVTLATGKVVPLDGMDDDEWKEWLKGIGIESLGMIPYLGQGAKSALEGWAYQQNENFGARIGELINAISTEDPEKRASKMRTSLKHLSSSLTDYTALPTVELKRLTQTVEMLGEDYGFYSLAPLAGSPYKEWAQNKR